MLREQILGQCAVPGTEREDGSCGVRPWRHARENGREEAEADQDADLAAEWQTSQCLVCQKIGECCRGDLRAADIHTVLREDGGVPVALVRAVEELGRALANEYDRAIQIEPRVLALRQQLVKRNCPDPAGRAEKIEIVPSVIGGHQPHQRGDRASIGGSQVVERAALEQGERSPRRIGMSPKLAAEHEHQVPEVAVRDAARQVREVLADPGQPEQCGKPTEIR